MAVARTALKLVVLGLVLAVALAGAVIAAVVLMAVVVARAAGLPLAGPLGVVDLALAEAARRAPLAGAVMGGAALGLVCSRAATRRRPTSSCSARPGG